MHKPINEAKYDAFVGRLILLSKTLSNFIDMFNDQEISFMEDDFKMDPKHTKTKSIKKQALHIEQSIDQLKNRINKMLELEK
jgi:hypothetical protein